MTRDGAVVVFAVGNPSRGDDAVGPLLLDRLAGWIAAEGRAAEFELVGDFQLQVEHALDLNGRRLALFIDAGVNTPAPFCFRELSPDSPVLTHTSHALSPEAVLAVHRRVEGREPPPAFVLAVRGEDFELGAEPSLAAIAHLEAAWLHLLRLCGNLDLAQWRQHSTC